MVVDANDVKNKAAASAKMRATGLADLLTFFCKDDGVDDGVDDVWRMRFPPNYATTCILKVPQLENTSRFHPEFYRCQRHRNQRSQKEIT